MNTDQLSEIRNFLLNSKLPIDIVVELQDVFISEINQLQKNNNIDFNQSFELIKEKWYNDLRTYWKGSLSLEDQSDYLRKEKKKIEICTIKEAFKIAFPLIIVIIILSNFITNYNQFNTMVIYSMGGLFVVAILYYFKNFKDFRMIKRYQNYVLTLHQHSIILFAVAISPFMNIIGNTTDHPEYLKTILSFSTQEFGFRNLFVFISVFIVYFGLIYTLVSQIKYLQQIQKIKPFLKYL